jgi:hypothetical protein
MVIVMRKNSVCFYLLLALIFFSCETVIDVDVPAEAPKLVVNCFINPYDQFVKVYVRQSNPVFGTSSFSDWATKEDADVVMTGPNGSVNIPYDINEGVYSIPAEHILVVAGGTYRLDVSAPGFTSVFATTTVPSDTPIFVTSQLVVEEETMGDGFTTLVFDYDFAWPDMSDMPNYYEISIQQYGSELLYENYDDMGDNTALMREQIRTYSGSVGDMVEPFHVYLLNTTEEYHRYKVSLKNVSFGDPFAEPSQIYSNITNGLGCFGSYTGSSVYITP